MQGGHDQTKKVLAAPSRWHNGRTLAMLLEGLKVQLPFCTLQKCSPVHLTSKCWDLIELVTPLQQ